LSHALQDFNVISADVNENNVYNIYAQAYTLECERLLKDLTETIIKKFLNQKTAVSVLVFSVRFDNDRLKKAC